MAISFWGLAKKIGALVGLAGARAPTVHYEADFADRLRSFRDTTDPALVVDERQPCDQGGEGPIGPPRIRNTPKLNG
jgi:hypothetical protein